MDVFDLDRAGDWDLQAIVKGYNTSHSVGNPPSYVSCRSSSHEEEEVEEESRSHEHGNEAIESLRILESGTSSFNHGCSLSPTARVQKHDQKITVGVSHASSQEVSKPRRRKNNQNINFVQQVTMDQDRALSDQWNWRKYGQKTIKGSPYPRSYYKCSSSRECSARKQVEHSKNDSGTFVITYIGEHNHPHPTRRHSQAGRTKERFDPSFKSTSPKIGESFANISAKTERSRSSPEFSFGNDCILASRYEKEEPSLEDIRRGGGGGGDLNLMWENHDIFEGLESLEGLEIDLLCDDFSF